MTDFISVAEAASLPPGRGRSIQVQGHELALWNVGGKYYCIDDQCPHRGAPLGAGTLEGHTVSCPMHGWTFNLQTGACAARPDRPATTYPTRVHEGQVQIQLPVRKTPRGGT